MKRSIVLSLFVILGLIVLIVLTGCSNGGSSKSNSNSIVGKYEIVELKAENVVYDAKKWKEDTTLDYELEVKDDNKVFFTMKYKENMDANGKEVSETEEYRIEDNKFMNDKENKEECEYEFKDGKLTMTYTKSKHQDQYVFKKK